MQDTSLQNKSRVLYLDIDDTLIVWSATHKGFGAPQVDKFIKWALEHFEVRWLTMWCPSGILRRHGCDELSYRLGNAVSPEILQSIKNPNSFTNSKCQGIDFDDPRPWVWVEDDMVPIERQYIEQRGLVHNFYKTNVSRDVTALQVTWKKLAHKFNLPGYDTMPYSKKVIYPKVILSDLDMLCTYREDSSPNHDALPAILK